MASQENMESLDGDEETKAKKVCLPGDITSSETVSALTTNVRIKFVNLSLFHAHSVVLIKL